jgi:Leucine-rich repeat (LRR) protein
MKKFKKSKIIQTDNMLRKMFIKYCFKSNSLCGITINSWSELLDIDFFDDIEKLDCSYTRITELGILPNKLRKLNCSNNKITELGILPENLHKLNCSFNKIKKLDNLPHNLQILDCSDNKIQILENLPRYLKRIECRSNKIKRINLLSFGLTHLDCSNNHQLKYCYLKHNKLKHLNFIGCYKMNFHEFSEKNKFTDEDIINMFHLRNEDTGTIIEQSIDVGYITRLLFSIYKKKEDYIIEQSIDVGYIPRIYKKKEDYMDTGAIQ